MPFFRPGFDAGLSTPKRLQDQVYAINTPRSWYVRKTGNDNNGGTSPTVRSTGTDGVTNGTNVLTSATAAWTSADVGHGIWIGGVNVWRIVVSVINANTLTFSGATVASGSSRSWTVGGAFLTIGKTMGTTTNITGGDTVYIGAGIYRGANSVTIQNPNAVISWVGDYNGAFTGDSGYVVLSSYLTNDRALGAGAILLTISGKTNLSFSGLLFYSNTGNPCVSSTSLISNITFTKCAFHEASGSGTTPFTIQGGFSNNLNILIDRCVFCIARQAAIIVTLPTGTGSDYNCGVTIKNCLIQNAGGQGATVTSTGAAANFGGGVAIQNCTIFSNSALLNVNSASISSAFPCSVYNCLMICGGGAALTASTTGQITEDYNIIHGSTPRTNVTAGAHSISDGSNAITFEFGQSWLWGFNPRPPFAPMSFSAALGFGNQAGAPSVDFLSNPRPAGDILLAGFGTATAGAATTLTDSAQTWGTNVFAGYSVKITGGTGSGQIKTISANTATVLTVDGNWKTNPDNTSTYVIYDGAMASSGTATSGTTTTLTDSNAAWGTNMWQGSTLQIDGGTGSGQSLTVVSNTATALTFASATAPDSTSTYQLYRGASGSVINNAAGCYEAGNTAVRETSTVRSGSNAIRIQGPGYQDYQVAVSATQTTFQIYARYDANYSGSLPQLMITNGAECGVSDTTIAQVGAAGQWEALSLTFTPTSAGIVTVRVISNCTTPTGAAFFDDFSAV